MAMIDSLEECVQCGRRVDHGYMVMDRGPFCSLPCTITGTRDLITDEDIAEAKEMMRALGIPDRSE